MKIQNKSIILFSALIITFIFCGAASATTLKTDHINTATISNMGATTNDQNSPAIDDTRVVWNKKIPLEKLPNTIITLHQE